MADCNTAYDSFKGEQNDPAGYRRHRVRHEQRAAPLAGRRPGGEHAISVDLAPPDAVAERFFAPIADRLEFVTGDVRDPDLLAGLAGRDIDRIVNGAAITPGVGPVEKSQGGADRGRQRHGHGPRPGAGPCPAPPEADDPCQHRQRVWRRRARRRHPLPEDGYVRPFPGTLYAITKLSAELVARRFTQLFELPLHMVRLASVYGPMDRDTPGRLIKCAPNVMVHKAVAGESWSVRGHRAWATGSMAAMSVARSAPFCGRPG